MRNFQGLADLLVGCSPGHQSEDVKLPERQISTALPGEWDNDVLALLVREATPVFINDALNTALPVLITV